MGRKIEDASEEITLQIEKKAESDENLNAYIYLIMDAQLNIQNGAFVSAIYLVAKNVYERTTHCIVHCSNWSRKTYMALDLLEKEYKNYFNFIIIICPMLKHKETYRSRKWFWDDPKVILIEPGNHLYDWVEKMGKQFAGFKTLFLIDDIIADGTLNKKDNLC